MKKLFVPIVAVATMLAFTSCGDDQTAPEITLPTEGIVINLGDEEAALKGVTAKDDKDGDVTNALRVEGLDWVGAGELVYLVKDKANNEASLKRTNATVRSEKLKGTYVVDERGPSFLTGQDTTMTYNVAVDEDRDSHTQIVISNFFDAYTAKFAGNGKSTTLAMIPLEIDLNADNVTDMTITGSAAYTKSGANYKLSTCDFVTTYATSGKVETFRITFR